MPYLFLSDIDGTLLSADTSLSQEIVDAALQFQKCGGIVSLCTGRSLAAARPVAEALQVNGPSILYGGAVIYDFRKDEFLYKHSFTGDILACVKAALNSTPDISMQVFTTEHCFLLRENARFQKKGVPELFIRCTADDVFGEIVKLTMSCEDPAKLERCHNFFPVCHCDFTFASRSFVDVVAAGSTKSDAAKRLSAMTGISLSHFFAAGDSKTDLEVMNMCGVSFAPGNAMPEVLQAAKYLVAHVQKGGMAQAFRLASSVILP